MLDLSYPTVTPGPPRPSRILTPKSLSRHSGQERHVIPGGGALLLQIAAGDRLVLVNDEGGQPCEVIAATETGRIDAALLGRVANSRAEGLQAMLATGEASLARLRKGLSQRGIDLATAGALRLFAPDTPAGARAELVAGDVGWLVIAAPGLPMAPEAQDTATPITLYLGRANPRLVGHHDLPDPLADPILDLRVKSATAERRGITSRSWTSMAASAPTSNALMRESLTVAFSTRWT
jgi:aminomethyltransferase